MQSVGIDTLVFIRAGYGQRTIFPSDYFGTKYEDDLLGFILDEAEKRNMKNISKGVKTSGRVVKNSTIKTAKNITRAIVIFLFLLIFPFPLHSVHFLS